MIFLGNRQPPSSGSRAITQSDRHWMEHAIALAGNAEMEGEVPVGAVVIRDGEIVGEGWNRTITHSDPAAHAEIIALRQAGKNIANYRLVDCALYVTLEPCCMCAGAMIHARLERVVFGAPDPKTGAAGGRFQVLSDPRHNHQPEVSGGCLADDCSEQLKRFFKRKRES
jgi:tRNA(adenine34) deaminase